MVGYLNYLVSLLIVTGLLILRFDQNIYLMARMNKEKKVAQFLGWVNIILGSCLLVATWAYQKWFW